MKTFILSNSDADKLLNLLEFIHEHTKASSRPKDRDKGRIGKLLKKKLLKQNEHVLRNKTESRERKL